MTLLDKSNLDHLERLIRWPELFLPFFGPNSAGKSSVINAILGIQAMPKGEGAVTGRVCAISYAEEASIELLPLDKFVEHLPGERVALTEPLTSTTLKDVLKDLLVRPPNLSATELAKWANMVVRLRFPFATLQGLGITILDVPGTFRDDNSGIMSILTTLLQRLTTPGIVFLYENPSFADAEVISLGVLESSIACSHYGASRPIFFISTKFDHDKYDGEPDWKPKAMQYFKEASKVSHFTARLDDESFSDCRNFAVINARDIAIATFNSRLLKPATAQRAREIFLHFQLRFYTWTTLLQETLVHQAYGIIKEGCQRFFTTLQYTMTSTLSDMENELAQAVEALQAFEDRVKTQLEAKVLGIRRFMKDRMKDPEIRAQIKQAGQDANISYGEQHKALDFRQEAMGAMRINAELQNKLHRLLVAPALENVEEVFDAALNDATERFLEKTGSNKLLRAAIASVFKFNNVAVDKFKFARRFGTTYGSFLNSLWRGKVLGPTLIVLCFPAVCCMSIAFAAMSLGNLAYDAVHTIDSAWKRGAALHLAEGLVNGFDRYEMLESVRPHIEYIRESLTNHISATIQESKTTKEVLATSKEHLPEYRLWFAKLFAECLQGQMMLEDPQKRYALVNKANRLGKGAVGAVYAGTWRDHDSVAVKCLMDPDNADIARSFFEEIVVGYGLVSQINHPNMLPILGVECAPPENEWRIILPLMHGSLNDLNPIELLPLHHRLDILYQMAVAVDELHNAGYMHRDLKLANFMYRHTVTSTSTSSSSSNKTGYMGTTTTTAASTEKYLVQLGDYGLCTLSDEAHSIVGTPGYMAPEVRKATEFAKYDQRADIYSLGQLFPMIVGDIAFRVAMDPTWAPLLTMTAENPNDRPSMKVVRAALAELCRRESPNSPSSSFYASSSSVTAASSSSPQASSSSPSQAPSSSTLPHGSKSWVATSANKSLKVSGNKKADLNVFQGLSGLIHSGKSHMDGIVNAAGGHRAARVLHASPSSSPPPVHLPSREQPQQQSVSAVTSPTTTERAFVPGSAPARFSGLGDPSLAGSDDPYAVSQPELFVVMGGSRATSIVAESATPNSMPETFDLSSVFSPALVTNSSRADRRASSRRINRDGFQTPPAWQPTLLPTGKESEDSSTQAPSSSSTTSPLRNGNRAHSGASATRWEGATPSQRQ